MKKVSFFIIISLITLSIQSQNDELVNTLQNIHRIYGSFFIQAVYIEGFARDLVIKTINLSKEDHYWEELDSKAIKLTEFQIDIFIFSLAYQMLKLEKKEQKEYFKDLQILCEIDRTVEIPFLYSETNPIELTELVWMMDDPRHLIEKHIQSKEQ